MSPARFETPLLCFCTVSAHARGTMFFSSYRNQRESSLFLSRPLVISRVTASAERFSDSGCLSDAKGISRQTARERNLPSGFKSPALLPSSLGRSIATWRRELNLEQRDVTYERDAANKSTLCRGGDKFRYPLSTGVSD